jgi:alpha-galactosidase
MRPKRRAVEQQEDVVATDADSDGRAFAAGGGVESGDRGVLHLRAGGTSLVIDCRGPGLPSVIHWGADIGDLDEAGLESLAQAMTLPIVSNTLDLPPWVGILPEHAGGWPGLPGLLGHRGGSAWSALFALDRVRASPGLSESGGGGVTVEASDPVAALGLHLEIEMAPSGVLRLAAVLRNQHHTAGYSLEGMVLALPVPTEASELLDLTGRHLRERSPQRQPFTVGSRVRDNRRGRTGADATLVLAAGTSGFGFRSGEVWGIHVGWSGNHRSYAERLPSGLAVLGGGELLLPGEISLEPGAEYRSPWLYAAYGRGLDGLSGCFHEFIRARPQHPRTPRPVTLNTWEAVYFDHDLDKLMALAVAAAEIGVERFVLDDGWFRHRRGDTAGLGDWYVDETVWPRGLHPLVDHVRSLGMEFGLWVEPEMVNPDSDLARAHPEWMLATGGRMPPTARNQQVLDISHSGSYAYILDRLDALVSEYRLSHLKWDHNRDLVDAGHLPGGEAGVHNQTLAVYRLIDELRRRHPGLEIESCSSGGSRIDLAILERTDRVWTSDCVDALERQSIQRWTGLLLPPELMGAHIGAPRAHTTSRTHDLAFRAGTAWFGHLGIEWDITTATPSERRQLAGWVALHKRWRGFLHSGSVVRTEHPDPALWVHGVIARDGSEAIFSLVAVATSVCFPPGRVRLPGLEPDARYRVGLMPPLTPVAGSAQAPAPWLAGGGITLTGRTLAGVGLPAPPMAPEHLLLVHVERV